MKLSTADADLFFGLMWSLQFYVNRQCQVLSNIDSVEAYATRPMEDLIAVRNALWETPELIESYVSENPDGLPVEELEIIRKWKRFVSDNFYVFRFQKKHTIFITQRCLRDTHAHASSFFSHKKLQRQQTLVSSCFDLYWDYITTDIDPLVSQQAI